MGAKKSPQERLVAVVMSTDMSVDGTPLSLGFFGDVTVEPWMVEYLRDAEASVRRLRREMEQRLAGAAGRPCDGCGQPFTATRSDARYCSGRCRQAALRVRRGDG